MPRTAGLVMLLLAVAGTPRPCTAQLNYFGQNKIQYRDFEWRVLRGEHLDVYHYPEEDEIARLTLAYGEESYAYLERKFGHAPARRIPIIVYASHADFEQTNVLPFVPPEGILGVTEFLKRRVALPFRGHYAEFRHTLRHELVHAFHLSVMTETFTRHARTRAPHLPLWFTEGLAEFWSAGEDSRDEMILRELTISGIMPSLEELTYLSSGLAYPLGGIIHRWLAAEYGDWRIQLFYRDLWRHDSFASAIAATYGVSLAVLGERFAHWMRQRYFPAVDTRRPLGLIGNVVADLGIKPVAYEHPRDSTVGVLYLSPRTGYMNIYSSDLERPHETHTVVQGERSAEFESFHPFASRLDVRAGIAVFTSKYLERDALFFWDLARGEVVGRYQFSELVSLLSPTWAPDGRSVAFSGLTISGFSDLYRLHLGDGRLERLTHDRYEDLDPSFSPDGTRLVFASDRTAYGAEGGRNLFTLDLATGTIRYLTYGPWLDETPRWAANERIYFSSDRWGVPDILSVDSLGNGRPETRSLTGAFDPQWVPANETLVFGGFSDLTYRIFRARPLDDSVRDVGFSLALDRQAAAWSWPELAGSPYARTDPDPYERRFTLDFAAGDALVAPGVASAGGALFLFSDLLSDHLIFVSVTAFGGDGFGNFFDNVNGTVFYLNQKRRLNWGLGAFRLRGFFREADFETIYEETSWGAFGEVRWPFSRFSRVEAQVRIEHSDRLNLIGGDRDEPRRVGLLASNFVSFVKDNSLWLPSGPIDGERRNITLGVTNDLSSGRFDSWLATVDHRRYFRLGQRAAYAVRAYGYVSEGKRPRRVNIGGSWGLRGYPRYGDVSGTRVFLLNQELRFPLSNFVAIGLPFGVLQFPGIQGAIFGDLGGAWADGETAGRGVLGSAGFSLRMPVFFPLVLRFDFGYRFAFGPTDGYLIPDPVVNRQFVDFFFGFNY